MLRFLFMMFALLALFNSVNALRKPVRPGSKFPPLWLPGMIVSELTTPILVMRIVVSAIFAGLGILEEPIGTVGLIAVGLSIVLLLPQYGRRLHAVRLASGPLSKVEGSLRERITGRPNVPEDIHLIENIEYAPGLTLDIYKSPTVVDSAPTLMYVHGGGWRGGNPHGAARVLFHELTRRGWVVATIRYPLSPQATFPDHLLGVKAAIAWAKTDGRNHGMDPGRLALCGGSAGAHLAALAALTPGNTGLQPGFEHIDTSVAACVPMYGVFDFFNRNKTRWDWPLIPQVVMKAVPEDDPERYRLASPLDQVNADAPPFLVIHGAQDSLVPPEEARVFVDALAAVAKNEVRLIEVPGAQHGFDAIASPRTRAVATLIEEFLLAEVVGAHA